MFFSVKEFVKQRNISGSQAYEDYNKTNINYLLNTYYVADLQLSTLQGLPHLIPSVKIRQLRTEIYEG